MPFPIPRMSRVPLNINSPDPAPVTMQTCRQLRITMPTHLASDREELRRLVSGGVHDEQAAKFVEIDSGTRETWGGSIYIPLHGTGTPAGGVVRSVSLVAESQSDGLTHHRRLKSCDRECASTDGLTPQRSHPSTWSPCDGSDGVKLYRDKLCKGQGSGLACNVNGTMPE